MLSRWVLVLVVLAGAVAPRVGRPAAASSSAVARRRADAPTISAAPVATHAPAHHVRHGGGLALPAGEYQLDELAAIAEKSPAAAVSYVHSRWSPLGRPRAPPGTEQATFAG